MNKVVFYLFILFALPVVFSGVSRLARAFANRLFTRLECPSRNQTGVFATGEIRQNIKFWAFWCVFLTKLKVDPESW